MLDILELPKAQPVDDYPERGVNHRNRKQSGEAHALSSQQQLRRTREHMRQRDGKDKRDKDSDVLEHGGRLRSKSTSGCGKEGVDSHCSSPKIFFASAWKRGLLRKLS
jgi:hypothetical protein